MGNTYEVLAPGPVNLHPRIQEALAWPMIHHRTPEFDRVLSRVLSRLRVLFQTTQPVFLSSATGSGGMEALLVNLLSPGDKVLAIDSGKFGERWADMAETYGAQVIRHKVPWGQTFRLQDIQDHVLRNLGGSGDGGGASSLRLILCQACETSTGVVHPLRELGLWLKTLGESRGYEEGPSQSPGSAVEVNDRPLLLVDGITALGAMPLPMEEWGIDGLVGGSQKSFMLPTGLTMYSFSRRAWDQVQKARCPRYYFDVRRENQANGKGETHFSSNVTLIRALDVALDEILGPCSSLSSSSSSSDCKSAPLDYFPVHLRKIRRRADFIRHFAPRLGFSFFANPEGARSDSVTALRVPPGYDGQKIRSYLEEKHHITIMGGQDQAKGKIIRIGHMGYITDELLVKTVLALQEALVASTDSATSLASTASPTASTGILSVKELQTWLEATKV